LASGVGFPDARPKNQQSRANTSELRPNVIV
jgi:hypothetical protein